MPAAELRPITVLVGRNSSGKSSFLRALPLLRQSLTTRTSSPILWFGSWVDFGDFDGAVTNNALDRSISFSFCLDRANHPTRYFVDEETGFYTSVSNDFRDLQLTVSIVKTRTGTRISNMRLAEGSNQVEYTIGLSDESRVSSLVVDGVEMVDSFADWSIAITPAKIFPSARLVTNNSAGLAEASFERKWDRDPIKKAVGELISPGLDQRTTGDTLGRLVGLLFSLSVVNKDTIKALASQSKNGSWRKLTADIGGADRRGLYQKLRQLLLAKLLIPILNSTSFDLTELLSSILYIGPARAKSDRYYRYQDLAVSEIDPDGQNFPMFLNSLSDARITEFSNWVRSLFGYGVSVGRDSGHITINLVNDRGTVNVVDTGYGISQILPVLGQVWWATKKPRTNRESSLAGARALILAIEQPELHLHPAHQALLADAFVSGLQLQAPGQVDRKTTTHFILETHSEAMINRLGALVAEKKIEPDQIQILVFNIDEEDDSKTQVNQVIFNEEGHLVDWPYDFFVPSV